MSDPAVPSLRWDLTGPEYTPPECPDWARVEVPAWVKPYQGKNGAPEPWHSKEGSTCGGVVKGIDRYQANLFILHRPETHDYLYSEYTPLDAGYERGLLPGYERVVERYTDATMSQTEKALALLQRAMPVVMRHPKMPPLGQDVGPDRNLMDEALLASGSGWCNEQARVFVRLCQVAGLQGRIVHLFGQNHTVAEFHADGRWVFVDASWLFVARSDDGELLSTADCHDHGPGQRAYAYAKKQRFDELLAMSDERLDIPAERSEQFRSKWREFDPEQIARREDITFGVINNPLPAASAVAASP